MFCSVPLKCQLSLLFTFKLSIWFPVCDHLWSNLFRWVKWKINLHLYCYSEVASVSDVATTCSKPVPFPQSKGDSLPASCLTQVSLASGLFCFQSAGVFFQFKMSGQCVCYSPATGEITDAIFVPSVGKVALLQVRVKRSNILDD